MITIVSGGTVLHPLALSRYEASSDAQTIVHPILDTDRVDVTIRPGALRAGTLELTFATEADALQAAAAHKPGAVCTLAHDDRPGVNMAYVPADRTTVAYDPAGAYTLTTGFHEVTT